MAGKSQRDGKPRDYAAEYARRIERGLAAGLSRTAARRSGAAGKTAAREATGGAEYRARVERGMARGQTREEAAGHPWYEPKRHKTKPAKGARRYRREDRITTGSAPTEAQRRRGIETTGEPLPDGAALRGLRAYIRAHPHEPNVTVSLYGRPNPGGSKRRRQGESPRIRARMIVGPDGKTIPALWVSEVRPVEELLDQLEYGEANGIPDADVLTGEEDTGLPEFDYIYAIEFTVPA